MREPLTVAEQVNLSADLIRLGQYEEAIRLLSWAERGERPRVLLLGNLATANQLAGNLDRARSALEQLQDAWPQQWPGLGTEQLAWYRQVERYHLKLVRLRGREIQRLPGRRRLPDQVDALFGPVDSPVRFVSESGKYEPGRIAAAERKKLPGNAVAVVQQLLIWLPDDTRLYWLLGELLNAQGDVTDAATVLDDCMFMPRGNFSDLVEHRRLLKEARPAEAAMDFLPQPAPAAAPTTGWAPRTGQLVLVGTLAGLVVLLLGYLQVRELRRRRRQKQPLP
jgi:tetratricopeptide (TPR) repeat protein